MKQWMITFCIFINLYSVAQSIGNTIKDNGIYLSVNDFKNATLFPSHRNTGKHTIKIIEPIWHSHQIWAKTDDSTYKFSYDTIWGYRSNKVSWRVYSGVAYIVTYMGKICLYELPVYSSIGTYRQQYFSATATSSIKEMTKSNLLEVYHSNKKFTDNVKGRGGYRVALIWNEWRHQYVCEDWL